MRASVGRVLVVERRRLRRVLHAFVCVEVALLLAPGWAAADVSVRRLRQAGASRLLEASAGAGAPIEVLAKMPGAASRGLVPLTGDWAVFRGDAAELDRALASAATAEWFFAPAKRLMMDLAGPTVELPRAMGDFGVDGSGVVLGVVDTGLDFRHPAFQNADGSTRVAWLLSFGQEARGVHAAIEAELGCTADPPCAVFSGEEIDQLLASGVEGELPLDSIGHGSHVTGIAAGRDEAFPGVAPAANLIVVQAAGAAGAASDASILLGVKFVFDRALEMGLPAVVNLSLGSSFGAHDGTSGLEQVIDELSAPPGRAVVVASGNDAGLFEATDTRYPDPLGIHAEAIVPRGSEVRVPLHIAANFSGNLSGYVFVWISSEPGDELSLAFDNGRGVLTAPVAVGETGFLTSSELGDDDVYELIIVNGPENADSDIKQGSLVFALSGTLAASREFELVLSGHGTAKVWLESGDDLTSIVFLPRARAGGTVTIPATAASVISVGASVNRESWTDYSGAEVFFPLGAPGSRAYFSGAGPSELGTVEPDVLAPGGYVISAMAQAADPRTQPLGMSQFASLGACPDPLVECFVVDDQHGVSVGTSMAAPMVAGAVALLLQRDPELTSEDIRDLLRAGAASPRPGGALVGDGSGILDIRGALLAQDLAAGAAVRLPHLDFTRVTAADVYLSATGQPLEVSVILRDVENEPAGGFDADRLEVRVDGPAEASATEVHPGMMRFWLAAEAGAGQKEVAIVVLFDGVPLTDAVIPITVDSSVYREGFALGGGSCQWVERQPRPSAWAAGFLGLLLAAAWRRSWRPAL